MIHKMNNSQQENLKKISIKKQKTADTTSVQESCYYCLMKQRFNVGSSSQSKCLEHSIQQKNHQSLTKDRQSILSLQQMKEYLLKVQQGIAYYYQLQKDSENLQNSLNPVWHEIKRLDQKLLRMFNQGNSFSEIQALQNKINFNGVTDKQKSQMLEMSYYDNATASDAIKQWVLHFHKILYRKAFQKDRPVKDEEALIGEQNSDLSIFKECMQRKFMLFVANLNRAQGKLGDALEKLLFYMQKSQSAGIVSHQRIQADIQYLQQDHHYQNMKTSGIFTNDHSQSLIEKSSFVDQDQSAVQRIIIAQCLSIEALLNHTQTLTSFN